MYGWGRWNDPSGPSTAGQVLGDGAGVIRLGVVRGIGYGLFAAAGRDVFDLFSVHLYGDLASIPQYLATARRFMLAHGCLKPVVVGEHAGPQPFEFPAAMAVMQEMFAAAFAEAPASQSTATPATARTSRRSPSPGRGPGPRPPSPTRSAIPGSCRARAGGSG
jgi:hypothetical protein